MNYLELHKDKVKHFILALVLCFIFCSTLEVFNYVILLSPLVVLVLCVGKECFDKYFKHTIFDLLDLFFGILGDLTGYLIFLLIKK